MSGIFKSVNLSLRQVLHPGLQEMPVKNHVFHAPGNKRRSVAELAQVFLHFGNYSISPIARFKRDVLHKAQCGNPVFPGIVWCSKAFTNVFGQPDPFYAFNGCNEAESIKRTYQEMHRSRCGLTGGQREIFCFGANEKPQYS